MLKRLRILRAVNVNKKRFPVNMDDMAVSYLKLLSTSLTVSGAVLLALVAPVCADEPKIADNSFLIEEAYNQEAGVVQHINSFLYDWNNDVWDYAFTQEWPLFSQDHQLSYTVPVSRVDDPSNETGVGDILLNYRYQLINKDNVAFAPRLSLILPTGDDDKGLGTGSVGYQFNLPISVELNGKLVSHTNLGMTITPDAEDPSGESESTTGINYGTSFVYLFSPTFNALVELVGTSDEVVGPGNERDDTFFINPGARFALNFESGLQIVPGISFPIGVGPSDGDYGVFFYLSFEHPFI